MTEFTPFQSLAGGMLIGVAASLLMLFYGRIAGLSGMMAAILPGGESQGRGWRLAFLIGAALAPFLLLRLPGVSIPFESVAPVPWIVISGLLVGVGVTIGGGCTSGHGICGNARLAPRSIVATITFMLVTGLTVYVTRHLIGGL